MDLDFNAIVCDLFLNEWDRDLPLEYFKRKFLIAKEAKYTAKAFFESCLMVFQKLENDMESQHCNGGHSDMPGSYAEYLNQTHFRDFIFSYDFYINRKYIQILYSAEVIVEYKKAINIAYEEATDSEKINNYNFEVGNKKLSLNQIALKHAWEGQNITKENCQKIAELNGHKSGDALYNHFCELAKKSNRIADAENKIKMRHKIELFESVLELIPECKKQSALEDIKSLKTIYEKNYL